MAKGKTEWKQKQNKSELTVNCCTMYLIGNYVILLVFTVKLYLLKFWVIILIVLWIVQRKWEWDRRTQGNGRNITTRKRYCKAFLGNLVTLVFVFKSLHLVWTVVAVGLCRDANTYKRLALLKYIKRLALLWLVLAF